MANVIEILIKAQDNASKEFDKVSKSTEELSKKQKVLQGAFKAAQGAIIGAGVAFLAQVPALTKQGIAIGKAEKALEGYAGSAENAEYITQKVVEATGGAISRFDAMQNATRLLAMGLADNAKEAAELTNMAVTLGAAMGKDAATAFEDFSLMLANQSIPRLDTFGISGAVVRERINELMNETAGMTREMAFMTAVMEEGNIALDKLAESGFQATDNVQRLTTEVANAKDGVSKWLADGLMPWIDGLYGVRDALDAERKQAIKNTDSYEDYIKTVKEVEDRAGILGDVFKEELTPAEYENQRRLMLLEEWHGKYDDAVQSTQNYLNTYVYGTGGVEDTTAAMDDLGNTVNNVTTYFDEYSTRLLFNEAAAHLDAAAQFELAKELDLLNPKTQMAFERVAQLNQVYDRNKDGVIDATEATQGYTASVAQLNREIMSMQDKTVTITVREKYEYVTGDIVRSGEASGARQVGGGAVAGQLLMVGEMGPELIRMPAGGRIMPNNETTNNYFNLTVNEAGRVVDPVRSLAMMRALA